MSAHVLYTFSGTGNSLTIAQGIKRHLSEFSLVSIVHKLQNQIYTSDAEVVGFVFPCHGLTTPIPVKRFIDRVDLGKADYIFAVVTRGGTSVRAFESISKQLRRKGKTLNASFIFDMPSNDPKFNGFTTATPDQLTSFKNNAEIKHNKLHTVITNREDWHDDPSGVTLMKNKVLNSALEKLVMFGVHHMAAGTKKYFYLGDGCMGCGICRQVCPTGKIDIKSDRPDWQPNKNCYMCYTCLNYCPTKAIQIHSKYYMKSYTQKNGRYHHPDVVYKDISSLNSGRE